MNVSKLEELLNEYRRWFVACELCKKYNKDRDEALWCRDKVGQEIQNLLENVDQSEWEEKLYSSDAALVREILATNYKPDDDFYYEEEEIAPEEYWDEEEEGQIV